MAALLVSLGAFILITFWVLHSLATIASAAYSFFCDQTSHTPLGPIPCAGPSPHKLLLGVLGAPVAALQIYALGVVVLTSWKARKGVNLEVGADAVDRTG
jgi:hypothetical protein